MQQFKSLYSDANFSGTFANLQSCLRIGDLDEIGDGAHLLYFNMIGLFSFRHCFDRHRPERPSTIRRLQARCSERTLGQHANLARRPQGAERQLMQEEQTNRRASTECPI